MKSHKKLALIVLLAAGLAAAQSCKLLFKSDYADLKAADLTAFVEAAYPDMYKRRFAESEQMRKQVINQYKQAFALAQAAEDAGLHKSDKFKKQMEISNEQILAAKYTERNPDLVITKEEAEAYYAAHKDQFESDLKFATASRKQPLTDEQKETQRVTWCEMKLRADKARQAGIDKDPGFAAILKFRKADVLANLYTQTLEEKNKLTDAEKKKYLAEHPEADADKLKEKAQGLLDRVKKGESFEKIADEFNEDGTKGRGGDLDWFGKGAMDADFEAAAFALQKGQTSNELVKSKFGYHIIRVDDRRMAPAATTKASATPAPSPAPNQKPEPKEEIHARHIYVDTRASEQFESQLIEEKVKRAMEDAALKYPVNVPTDFIVKVAGFDPNRVPGIGGGTGGQMRGINPGENK
ncbi:MAG: Chaperone SurA [Acidobacteria bacterium]|nr:Chaperone SurA [Acidobacteriota bacterium]